MFGKENKKKQLILKLPVIFAKIQLEHHISPGDFPDCQKMQVGDRPGAGQKGAAFGFGGGGLKNRRDGGQVPENASCARFRKSVVLCVRTRQEKTANNWCS